MNKIIIYTLIAFLHTGVALAQEKPLTKKEMDVMKKQAQQMMNEAMQDLSPEEKKMMEDAMKQAEQMAKDGKVPGDAANTRIPEKQTSILSKMPKISSEAQYAAYLENLRTKASKKIESAIIKQVDATIAKQKSNPQGLNNLAPAYFLQKSPKAAAYAAIRAAQLQNQPLPQNNLAVILHLTGYPQYAIPVLEYLDTKFKDAGILNNLGQSYLSLGDKEKALRYFTRALQVNPNHSEANCGTALIKMEEGKMEEAKPHIEKALKNGYSEALAQLATQKKINLDYNALKCDVPEYFNPGKYKPVAAAARMEDIKPVLAQREEMTGLFNAWQDKKFAVDKEEHIKMDNIILLQAGASVPGLFPNSLFGKKALFMVTQTGKYRAERAYQTATDDWNDEQAANVMHDELEKNISQQIAAKQPSSAYESCQIETEEVKKYLRQSAEFYDNKVRRTVYPYYDIANQQLYWCRFLLNEEQYKTVFYHTATELMDNLRHYEKFQRLGRPDYVVTHCEKILANLPKPQSVSDQPDAGCPVKLKIPLGVGSIKSDCKGWEIEGGEGAVVGVQKDYKTGEFTVAFGVGANLELPEIGVGTKGQAFFKFDKDFSPIDCGMVLEAGGEAAAGPVMIAEEKINATIGMTSGINISAVHAGDQLDIFQYDPGKP